LHRTLGAHRDLAARVRKADVDLGSYVEALRHSGGNDHARA
jgi:hypothetical protein